MGCWTVIFIMNNMVLKKALRSFSMMEVIFAIFIIATVLPIFISQMMNANLDIIWSTKISLADQYLDREAALVRRLPQSVLNARGFIQGTASVSNNVPMCIDTLGSTDINYNADEVRRLEIPIPSGYKYLIGVKISTYLAGSEFPTNLFKSRLVVK